MSPMHPLAKVFLYGFLSWFVPFVISFFFYMNGQLSIPQPLFKSLMVVVGVLSGSALALYYLKPLKEGYIRQGVVLGVVWLAINLILDLLLVNRGLLHYTYAEYLMDIGLRYLSIPIITIALGIAANQAEREERGEKTAS